MKRFAALLTLGVTLSLASLSDARVRETYTGARSMGMGNANLALIDDWSAMLSNPATLDLFMRHMYLSVNMGTYFSPSLFDLLSFTTNHANKLTNPDGLKSLDNKFFDDLYSIDGKWSTVGLVPSAGFIARTYGYTYGFGGYWDIPNQVMMESGVLVPKIFLGTQADFVLMGSLAKRFLKIFSVGGSFKWVRRVVLDEIALTYTETLEFVERFDKERFSALKPLTTTQYGPGLDAGAVLHMGEFRLAMSVQDLLAFIGKEFLSPRLNIGAAYKILPLMEFGFLDDVTAALDIRNMTKRGNFFTKLNMGLETRMDNFDFRLGLHQGYPTIGTSVHFMLFHVDYLFFTKELGLFPNEKPLSTHFFQVGADIHF